MSDLDACLRRVARALPSFLETRRWFGAKGQSILGVELIDHAVLDPAAGAILAIAEVTFRTPSPLGSPLPPAPLPPGERGDPRATHIYSIPLVLQAGGDRAGIGSSDGAAVITAGDGDTAYDGLTAPAFCRALLAAVEQGREIPSARGGRFAFSPFRGGPRDGEDSGETPVRVMGAEQSNTSIVFGDALILKAFRRLQPGINPELEILRFLAERTTFDRVPRLCGWAEYRPLNSEPIALAILQSFIPSRGDGWSWALGVLGALFASPPDVVDDASVASHPRASLDRIADLGTATAGLHLALASADNVEDFASEPIVPADIERWRRGALDSLKRGFGRLRETVERAGVERDAIDLPLTDTERLARTVLADEERLRAQVEGLEILTSGTTVKMRHHGDYHLGQVLDVVDGWVILDFEGEPLRPLAERRALHTPLRDVAGLLRSLDYARHAALRDASGPARGDTQEPPPGDDLRSRVDDEGPPRPERGDLPALAATWARLARRAFLDAYLDAARRGGARFLPPTADGLALALGALEVEKALYELEYELGNRPDWVAIPLAALAELR